MARNGSRRGVSVGPRLLVFPEVELPVAHGLAAISLAMALFERLETQPCERRARRVEAERDSPSRAAARSTCVTRRGSRSSARFSWRHRLWIHIATFTHSVVPRQRLARRGVARAGRTAV